VAYIVELEPSEELIRDVGDQGSEKSEPFRFAVSNQSAFVPRKKLIAVDPYYFERVPTPGLLTAEYKSNGHRLGSPRENILSGLLFRAGNRPLSAHPRWRLPEVFVSYRLLVAVP
jgi:hypothetical protein